MPTRVERTTIAAGKVMAGDHLWIERLDKFVPVKYVRRDEQYVILDTMAGYARFHNMRAVNVERTIND